MVQPACSSGLTLTRQVIAKSAPNLRPLVQRNTSVPTGCVTDGIRTSPSEIAKVSITGVSTIEVGRSSADTVTCRTKSFQSPSLGESSLRIEPNTIRPGSAGDTTPGATELGNTVQHNVSRNTKTSSSTSGPKLPLVKPGEPRSLREVSTTSSQEFLVL